MQFVPNWMQWQQSKQDPRKREADRISRDPGREMNDTTRLIVTVVLTALLVALIVYGLGIVGEESVSVNDATEP